MTDCQAETCVCAAGRVIEPDWWRWRCVECGYTCHYACVPGGVPVHKHEQLEHCGAAMEALHGEPAEHEQGQLL